MEDAAHAERAIYKLLLLGAGESGKSTLFKQMISIYGTGFSKEELLSYSHLIIQNMKNSARVLADHADIGGGTKTEAGAVAVQYFKETVDTKTYVTLPTVMGTHMRALWADEGIQLAYERRNRFQLTDGTKYYFDNIDRIGAETYVPTEDDILRVRVRTTGIVENEFVIEDSKFRMFDVGGQRNERKKWMHCFEDVTAVLFVVAISAFDQNLFEDESKNRLEEALELFAKTVNSEWFRRTHVILFLNKKDVFTEKMEAGASITTAFPEYKGADTIDESAAYITEQFVSTNAYAGEKKIFTHVTCATEKTNVQHIFQSVRSIVIRQNIEELGLLADRKSVV